jgi:AraC family transcriptional regulator, regulatory protein of adaptative response / methylated-DNA-[protein]-cysteine methyltransferase
MLYPNVCKDKVSSMSQQKIHRTGLSFEQMYQAIGNQNTMYEGAFITAVKTTGIFCRPSCRARKPNIENVVFYQTPQQALQHGYRPCKVCKPMEYQDQAPAWIAQLIETLHQSPSQRITDWDLKQQGLSPETARRWFKKHHSMTFQGYQRLLRINAAYKQMKAGTKVEHSAYDNGYESVSGLKHSLKQVFGVSVLASDCPKQVLNLVRITTPLGPMFAAANDAGLCLLEFTDRRALESEFTDLEKRLKAQFLPGSNAILEQTETQIDEYFSGQRAQFSIPLLTPGTDFQQKVWQTLNDIPYGQTRSYKQQADTMQKPKAVRAVATANGCNRIAIVIPCHRVIGSDGSLTGYAGGLHRKQWLLEHEAKHR